MGTNVAPNNLLFCGDYNFDFFKIDWDSKVTDFYDTKSVYLLTPLITKRNRVTNQPQTLIDTIFVSKPPSKVAGVFTFDVSDNFPIFAVFKNFFWAG